MIILTDAFVFSFNRNHEFGRYSLLIKENRIAEMVKSSDSDQKENTKVKKWIEQYGSYAEIIDCSTKIIIPPFYNSCIKSEGSLIHYLLRNRHYENNEGDIYTDFIFNYIHQELQTDEMKTDLQNIYNYSFCKNLKSGTGAFNEVSLRKDANHFHPITNALKLTGQKISLSYPVKQDIAAIRDYKYLNPAYYLTDENLLTIYDISNLTELRSHNIERLFLEVATNKEVTKKFRQTFRKPVIMFLDDYNLIDCNTSLINPIYLSYEEIKIIKDKGANIIICPSDLIHFTNHYFPIDDFISQGINYTIGTGWLGEDLMTEIGVFRNKYKELNISSEELLKSALSSTGEIYFGVSPGQNQIEPNKPADMIFIDLSDIRFQFYPESYNFNDICDFIIDNFSVRSISDVMIGGDFKVKNNKFVNSDENKIIEQANETRKRLYKAGKYEQLSARKKQKENIEKLDLRGRDDEEIKMFSETGESISEIESKEEFRIKSKVTTPKHRVTPGQKNLFEETNDINIIQSEDYRENPLINLLFTEIAETKNIDEEISQLKEQAKSIDERIMKKAVPAEKKPDKNKILQTESKIELPKNVKLKFGDD